MSALPADEQLQTLLLETDDPESQAGLLDRIPADAKLLALRNVYACSKADRAGRGNVHCAVCNRSVHRRGFTGELVGGGLFLCGKDCGAERFGVDFGDALKDLKALQDAQYERNRWRSFDKIAADLDRELQEWRPALNAMVTTRHRLFAFEDVRAYCEASVIRHDGQMMVSVRVKDVAAMARRRSDNKDDRVIYTHVEKSIGRLGGAMLFRQRYAPSDVLNRAIRAAREYAAVRGTGRQRTKLLKTARREAEDAFADLKDLAAWNEAGFAFFRAANLRKVCDWMHRLKQRAYTVEGESLVGEAETASLAAGCDHLDEEPFRLLAEYKQGL